MLGNIENYAFLSQVNPFFVIFVRKSSSKNEL